MANFSKIRKDANVDVDVEIDNKTKRQSNQRKCDWVTYVGAFVFTLFVAVITAPRGTFS